MSIGLKNSVAIVLKSSENFVFYFINNYFLECIFLLLFLWFVGVVLGVGSVKSITEFSEF